MAFLIVAAFLHLAVGCATSRVHGPGGGIAQLSPASLEARVFPELRLHTKDDGAGQVGKIIGLQNRVVRFLPTPYWNVEALRIDLADIVSIAVPTKSGGPGKASAAAFGIGFIVTGGLAAAVSKYDSDYQAGLILAPVGASCVALCAMAIRALSGSAKEIRYDLASMSDEERAFIVLKLMGLGRS
jgi:hypothetical protein